MKKLLLIGVGLIASSIARDVKRLALADEVIGIDTDLDNLHSALSLKIIDRGSIVLEEDTVKGVDCIILAVPLLQFMQVLKKLSQLPLKENCLLTDVASVKAPVAALYQRFFNDRLEWCVPVHPIAGTELSGAAAGRAYLFNEKKTIICPLQKNQSEALNQVKEFWQALGSIPIEMDAERHDYLLGAASHLPQLLASTYMAGIEEEAIALGGSGFRDFTRIAASNPAMWVGIGIENRQVLIELLSLFEQDLTQLKKLLQSADQEGLQKFFAKAQAKRQAQNGKIIGEQ